MPKLAKAVPKYRKHSSGNARVSINGRDYLLGPWNSKTSIREYDRIVAEFLASGRSPTFGIETESYSVAMLIRDYMRHCRSYYGTKVTSEYHRILPAIKPLRKLYADYDADQIGPVQYKAVRQSMIEVGLRPLADVISTRPTAPRLHRPNARRNLANLRRCLIG